ncbi:MAG TPA: protein kinase, partial [Gemmatimonadales bacterium]|nr:protein kinase [Gemmatimonadales bacterium]
MKPERWQRIDELYHAALELEAARRAVFLEEACAGDEKLRREVESLLASHAQAESFMAAPALEVAAASLAEEVVESLVGRQLGCYQVLSLLGAGGMGEVYRARDTKLGREVALKVLPEVFAQDPERLARFRREAQVLASLNHPSIGAIYGLEESDGLRVLVLELVPGKTLAELLSDGPLGVEEALRIGSQIAEALEAAHEKGTIHRDLKPANIKVTPEGKAKVLDFGLAKAFAADRPGADLSGPPAVSEAGTGEGLILGTAGYMSPEQARGKPVDKRTDIWSFGCVLYEALTGKRAFAGDTVSDTISRILEHEPDWRALPETTPPSIRVLLRRCMEKDPRRRLHDIADARIEIEDALTTPDRIEPASAAAGRIPRGWRPALLWGLTCLVVGAITASIALWKVKPPPPPAPVSRLTIALPPGERLAGLEQPAVAVSPDGTRLAYLATQGGGAPQLYLRAMDSLESKPISGTEGAANPFFSPDGQWVGFFAGGKLKKVSMSGGAAVTLANAAFPRGASWGSQGIIVFAPSQVSHLQQVSEAGGAPQALTRLEKGEIAQGFPEFLPGGKAVLFAASITFTNWTNAQVAVYSLETGERRNLIQGGTSPRYARSGHLVYAQGGTLMAAPFDPERLVLTGAAVPVVESVRQSVSSGGAHYSLSATGSLVYVPGGIQATQRRLVWVSRGGAEQVVAAPAHEYRNPRLSPDGRQVAVAVEEQQN